MLDDYETGEKIQIDLDSDLSPVENANRYYKLYSKAKTANEIATEMMVKTEEKIEYYEKRMEYAEQMRNAAQCLGYGYSSDVVQLAFQEWRNANTERLYYQQFLDDILAEEALWEARAKEYPDATAIWLYLKNAGYNDYVCAGILGNIMAECGGNTLSLKVSAIGADSYYGICQWSKGYADVWYQDLTGQLDFLIATIESEFKTFGKLYKRGFTYDDFINLQDSEKVALAFAKVYERCNSKHYAVREDNSLIAYDYFVSSDSE